jgi:hypothetical protein
MDPVLARIDEWQHAGLIDPTTADRLRAAEAATAAQAAQAGAPDRGLAPTTAPPAGARPIPAPGRIGVSAADVLGPGPTVVEMFAYLGGGFLLAAWTTFVTRLSGDNGNFAVTAGGLLVAAVVLAAIGLVLRTGDDRRRRAAGVAFLGATLYTVGAAAGMLNGLNVYGSVQFLILATIGVAVAAIVRFIHAGLLTQFGLLAAITTFAAAALQWLRDIVAPVNFSEKGEPIGAVPNPLLLIGVSTVVWLLVAVGMGLLAVRETGARRDSAAAPGAPGRRATLTRFWAGSTAVAGLASSLSTSGELGNGDWGRIVAPWIMDAALVVLAAILVERAFRRHSGAFLFAAGVALVIALTDFNFTYLTSSVELGLLIEGGLLLAVGFGADRLRRRLAGPAAGSPPDRASDPSPGVDPAAV